MPAVYLITQAELLRYVTLWTAELLGGPLKEVIPGSLDGCVKSCWAASWFGLFDQQYCTIVVISGFVYSAFKHASFVTSVPHEPTFCPS